MNRKSTAMFIFGAAAVFGQLRNTAANLVISTCLHATVRLPLQASSLNFKLGTLSKYLEKI
jgi:hypothetical protein